MITMAKAKSKAAAVPAKGGFNPFQLSSMYGKNVTQQNAMVDKEMPWSRSDSPVPSSMVGATRNVQEGA